MGVNSSKTDEHLQNRVKSAVDENVDNFYIPYDLLVDILSFVPNEDLLKHCQLVCKLWKDIIDGHSLWKIKCEREKKIIPHLKMEKIPDNFYRLIHFHNPYGTNLLKNGCGENSLDDWVLKQNSGDGFAVEDPPKGADPVPSEVGLTGCFATSFNFCQKYQLVDLFKRGVHPDVLNCSTTKIEIGEWYAARFDCGSTYKLEVFLLADNFYETLLSSLDVSDYALDFFEFEHKEEQWVGKEWHKISHTFENIVNTRYVLFQHSGKDTQFWAGHYGSKMTGAYVKVIV